MPRRADEADLREVLGVMADQVVDVAHDHLRREEVARRVHVSAEEEIVLADRVLSTLMQNLKEKEEEKKNA